MQNKVLVVESDAGLRAKMEDILQKMLERGGELFFTDQVDEAYKIIQQEKPQIVFLDQSLQGIEVQNWKEKGVHIIYIVPKGTHTHEEHIVKPFSDRQVQEMCEKYLSQDSGPAIRPM